MWFESTADMRTPFIVAEMSANHLGSLDRAVRIVEKAAKAGAHAIKLQCWTKGEMVGNPDSVIQSGTWRGRRMADLYEEAYTPWDWFEILKYRAQTLGMEFFASSFDLKALAFLESLGVKRHKIASFELVDLELIAAAAKTGKPLILSTGMARPIEITDAIRAAAGADLTLLHCVSGYPAPLEEMGLCQITELLELCPAVGLSDHTMSNTAAIIAVSLGATMIEKHLTLSRSWGGPDSCFSLEPDEFESLVRDCRAAVTAIGDKRRVIREPSSQQPQLALRRSLWWAQDVPAGAKVSREAIRSARPANGLPCWRLPDLLDSTLRRAVKAGTPVSEQDF